MAVPLAGRNRVWQWWILITALSCVIVEAAFLHETRDHSSSFDRRLQAASFDQDPDAFFYRDGFDRPIGLHSRVLANSNGKSPSAATSSPEAADTKHQQPITTSIADPVRSSGEQTTTTETAAPASDLTKAPQNRKKNTPEMENEPISSQSPLATSTPPSSGGKSAAPEASSSSTTESVVAESADSTSDKGLIADVGNDELLTFSKERKEKLGDSTVTKTTSQPEQPNKEMPSSEGSEFILRPAGLNAIGGGAQASIAGVVSTQLSKKRNSTTNDQEIKTNPQAAANADKSNGKGNSAGAATSSTGSTTDEAKPTSHGKSESAGNADKSNGKGILLGSMAGKTDLAGIDGRSVGPQTPRESDKGKEGVSLFGTLRGGNERSRGGDGGKINAMSEYTEKGSSTASGDGNHASKQRTSKMNPLSSSTKLETMSIDTMDAVTQDAKQYVRGDPTTGRIDYQDGSNIFNEGGDGNSPFVIGGRKRGWQAEAQSELYADSSNFQDGVRFSVCSAAVISVLLLLVFHFEVLNEGFARYVPPGSLWAPNSWEFIVYTQYVQQIAAISALTLLKTPYFLWNFTDLFAWANFLVYRATDEYSTAGRRLMTVILGGLVGYGDRIGTDEMNLLTSTCAGFAIVIGFFLGVVLGSSIWSKWRERHNQNGRRGVVWRCLGLVLLVWFFSLLPLSMVVSFEVSMEFKAHSLELWPLLISFGVVVVVIFGGILVVSRAILHRDQRRLSKLRPRAVWGAFYSEFTYRGRLFFLLMVALQICTGLCLGAADDSEMILIVLIGLYVLFLVALFIVKPFSSNSSRAKCVMYGVTVLKIVNLAIAFAFLPSSTLSVAGLSRAANTFIALNSLVILGWCLRHLVMFCVLAVASAKHEVDRVARETEMGMGASPLLSMSELVMTKPREVEF